MRPEWLLIALFVAAAPAGAASKGKKSAPPAPAPAAAEKVPEKKAEPAPTVSHKVAEALSDDDFQAVLDSIQDAGAYANSRMSALQFAMDGKHFRMEQVARLVELFSFSEDKLNVVKLLKSAIVDPANTSVLLARFPFPSDKEAVTKLLER